MMPSFSLFSATATLALAATSSSIPVATAANSNHCNTLLADFQRRQLSTFKSDVAYDITGGAKHVPFLTVSDNYTASIVVGNGDEEGGVWHPMVASDDPAEVHWISHIMAVDQNGEVVAIQNLNPTTEAPATMEFSIPAGVTELTAYAWCNLHGLWVGDTMPIEQQADNQFTSECIVDPFHSDTWDSLHADFTRQQLSDFGSDKPFSEADGEKHVPYITVVGSASIFVGNPKGDIHPMDGEAPHWITELYVVDQTGSILDLTTLDPTNVDTATYDFTVPEVNGDGEKVTSLTAYSWCNLHGLYVSPTVEISEESAATSEEKNAATCGGVEGAVFMGAALLAVANVVL